MKFFLLVTTCILSISAVRGQGKKFIFKLGPECEAARRYYDIGFVGIEKDGFFDLCYSKDQFAILKINPRNLAATETDSKEIPAKTYVFPVTTAKFGSEY